jgi:hypothetical protein
MAVRLFSRGYTTFGTTCASPTQLSDALVHLCRLANPLTPPAPADVAALRQVAASGTASARVVCPIARRYDATCLCRFPARKSAQTIVNQDKVDSSKFASLGVPYPNPADVSVQVLYALASSICSAQLIVSNALGQQVWAVPLSPRSGEV